MRRLCANQASVRNSSCNRRARLVVQAEKPTRSPKRSLERQEAFRERPAASQSSSTATSASKNAKLPRGKVIEACVVTSSVMGILGVGASFGGAQLLSLAGSSIQSIAATSLLHLPTPQELLVAAGTGTAVTAARFASMLVWRDLSESTNAANFQVGPALLMWQPGSSPCVHLDVHTQLPTPPCNMSREQRAVELGC
jgi:hypothetical protein